MVGGKSLKCCIENDDNKYIAVVVDVDVVVFYDFMIVFVSRFDFEPRKAFISVSLSLICENPFRSIIIIWSQLFRFASCSIFIHAVI